MKGKQACFQFFFASKNADLPYPNIPTRDVLHRRKTEPHMERRMENWCPCKAASVTASVRCALELADQGGQHYMVLTTNEPGTGRPLAVGMLEFSRKAYRSERRLFPSRWHGKGKKKNYLPYVGSKNSKFVSWSDAFDLRPWMDQHGTPYMPGKRCGILRRQDEKLLSDIIKHFRHKKDQTDKFLRNVGRLERLLKKKYPQRWKQYWKRKTGTAGTADKCATQKNTC